MKVLIDKPFICWSNNTIYVENLRKRTTFINNNWTLLVKIDKLLAKLISIWWYISGEKFILITLNSKFVLTARD